MLFKYLGWEDAEHVIGSHFNFLITPFNPAFMIFYKRTNVAAVEWCPALFEYK